MEFSDPESEPRQLIAQFKTDLKMHVEQLVKKALPQDISLELAQTRATTVDSNSLCNLEQEIALLT